MNLLSAAARNKSCYELQTEIMNGHSSHFSQVGIFISDQLKINAYFSIEHKNKILNYGAKLSHCTILIPIYTVKLQAC